MMWALELQGWDYDIVCRKGAIHHVPDALSRGLLYTGEVAAFESIQDSWYQKRLDDVEKFPCKFYTWKVEDGMLYKFRREELLDPIQDREEAWKLVVQINYRERIVSDAH